MQTVVDDFQPSNFGGLVLKVSVRVWVIFSVRACVRVMVEVGIRVRINHFGF